MTEKQHISILDWVIYLVEFILVLIVILDCNSVYRHWLGWEGDPKTYALWIANISAWLLVLLYLIKDKSNFQCIKDYKFVFLISFVFVFEFNALNALKKVASGYLGYFFFFMNAMVILYLIYRKNQEPFRLLYLMEYLILFIAVTSVILWFGSSVLELWGRNEDVRVWWGGKYFDANYLNLCIRRWVFTGDLKKNLGIFVEPPMYGLFLGFGLYTELFMRKKANPCIVGAFLVALISCKAILAIMLALLAVFFVVVELIKDKKYSKIIISAMVALTIAGVMVLFFHKMKTGWGSFATHIDDFVAALKCWTRYPILGCGYDCEVPIQEFMSDFRKDNLGLSNSAAVVLAEGGIVLFIYYFLPFLLMMLAFFKKNRKLAYWAAGMFLFWVVVIFHTRLFIFFLLAFGYSMIELSIPLHNSKEKTKKISFCLAYPMDNCTEDDKLFGKVKLDLPWGFIFVMHFVLSLTAIYGIVNHNVFPMMSLLAAAVVLLVQLITVFINLAKRKMSKMQNTVILFGLWLIFMILGHLYKVLDSLYVTFKLHIQDCGWSFLLTVTILYAIGIAVNMYSKRKETV